MTTSEFPAFPRGAGAVRGAPYDAREERYPLYHPEFATDPHTVYDMLRRRYGSLAPVELSPGIPATLVIGYSTALRVLNDPERFPADPRAWQKDVPPECPVLPVLEWRPQSSRSAGAEFTRYRTALTAGFDTVDQYGIHSVVEAIAGPLINAFCETGSAELMSQYLFPLTFQMINHLTGCPLEIGQQLAAAIAAMLETAEGDSTAANERLGRAFGELVLHKKSHRGADIASVLLESPSELSDEEVGNMLASIYGGGLEFQINLVANTLLLILTDDRFGGSVLGGNLSTRDAIDEVLFDDPPVANMLTTFPRMPILLDDVWLPANQPVLISMAACNRDPAIRGRELTGNRSHLAWGAGPHACPAQSMAYMIAECAIDQLLDAIPDMEANFPGGTPTWRPGPFHRALAGLPVTFTPSSPLGHM